MAIQAGVLHDRFDRPRTLLAVRCVSEQFRESKRIPHDVYSLFDGWGEPIDGRFERARNHPKYESARCPFEGLMCGFTPLR